MKITELPMGSQVTVRSGLGTDFLDFESKDYKKQSERRCCFFRTDPSEQPDIRLFIRKIDQYGIGGIRQR